MTESELLKLKEAYEAARKECWAAADAYIAKRTGTIDYPTFAAALARMNAARAAYEAERNTPTKEAPGKA